MEKVSPSLIMELVQKIENTLWAKYDVSKYKKVTKYIERWQTVIGTERTGYNFEYQNVYNFYVKTKDGNIDLFETLHSMDDELLFQIAVDLGIEIPSLIYGVAEIKGLMAKEYEDAGAAFEKAFSKVSSEPDMSIQMANSALEAIIKRICKDERISNCDKNDTLYKLTTHLLQEFKYFPTSELNSHIRDIGSSLLKISKSVEAIRSENTDSHGKLKEDYVIQDPLYSKLILNTISTVGLFLLNFYEKKYPKTKKIVEENNNDKRT